MAVEAVPGDGAHELKRRPLLLLPLRHRRHHLFSLHNPCGTNHANSLLLAIVHMVVNVPSGTGPPRQLKEPPSKKEQKRANSLARKGS